MFSLLSKRDVFTVSLFDCTDVIFARSCSMFASIPTMLVFILFIVSVALINLL
uniref:Uncharacterized protein n=1 Tax=Arundo donax TaxID=35708 RepID=A0A0A9E134_ARUDO